MKYLLGETHLPGNLIDAIDGKLKGTDHGQQACRLVEYPASYPGRGWRWYAMRQVRPWERNEGQKAEN